MPSAALLFFPARIIDLLRFSFSALNSNLNRSSAYGSSLLLNISIARQNCESFGNGCTIILSMSRICQRSSCWRFIVSLTSSVLSNGSFGSVICSGIIPITAEARRQSGAPLSRSQYYRSPASWKPHGPIDRRLLCKGRRSRCRQAPQGR